MGFEEQISSALGILFFAGVIIGFFLLCFSYLSDFFNEYNTQKDEELRRKKWAEERDKEIMAQAKNHTIDCTEQYVKTLREKKEKLNSDFDVDFNINLSGSVVKTEVVYAE